jgi:hypothetical protein
MSEGEEAMIREATAFCAAVATYGIMHSNSLAAFARLRNVYDGKPVEGKWAKWSAAMDKRQGIPE